MIRKILPTATLILTLLALSLSAAPSWAGKFYKWVDAEGVTHYSVRPPVDADAQTESLTIKTPKQSQAAEEDDTVSTAEAEEVVADSEEEKAIDEKAALTPKELAAIKKQDKENCDVARKNLYTLSNRARVVTIDKETNEHHYFTEEEIAKQKEESRQAVKEFCE